MSQARYLLVTDNYLPHVGGSRIYYHHVASMLAPDLAVLTRKRRDSRGFDERAGYTIRRVPLLSGPPAWWRSAAELVDCFVLAGHAVRDFPAVQAYLAGDMITSAAAAALAARQKGIPFGVVLHDEPLAGAGKLESRLRRWVFRKAGVIVAASSYAARRAREIAGEGAVIFSAPPGVDTDVFCPGPVDEAVLKRYGVQEKAYILSVGRLVDYKNISSAIETTAQVREGGLKLVVVGEGPERPALEREAARLGLQGKVFFAGGVAREDLVCLYRGALAYVFPSRPARGEQHEGVGMGVLEAAACGCVVIASTATSAEDFVRHGQTGLLFDPGEKDGLTRAVRSVLDSPETMRTMALEAVAAVRQGFQWGNTAAAVKAALEEITSKARR